jgi:GLPGLI family protein
MIHRRKILILSCLLTCGTLFVQAQKILSEGTVVYDVTVQTGSKEPKMADVFDGASGVIYLKGSQSRTEFISALATFVTIHDNKSGNGVLLREYGPQKLMIKMTGADWEKKNKKYDGINFTQTDETKTIAGYKCLKAVAQLKDGTSFTVYYTPEITTENKDYEYQFKSLQGLPLEYESTVGDVKVKYTASKISFDPVPIQKFEIPKSGYRELTYEESLRGKTN